MGWDEKSRDARELSALPAPDPEHEYRKRDLIAARKVVVGMSKATVREAIGSPHKAFSLLDGDTLTEIWIQNPSPESPVIVFRHGSVWEIHR